MAADEEEAADMKLMQLKEEQLDFVYIYPEGSGHPADEVIKKLENAGLTGRKYDAKIPFDSWYLDNKNEMRKDLYDRSTLILFHVDNNLHEDNEMIKTKDEKIEEAIYRPKQNIIPIWYVSKGKLEEEAFDALFGLRSINGVNPHSSSFEKTMKSLVDMPQFMKARKEREDKQADKLKKYQLKLKESPKPKANGNRKKREQTGTPQRVLTGQAFWEKWAKPKKKFSKPVPDPDESMVGKDDPLDSISAEYVFESDGNKFGDNEAVPKLEQKGVQPVDDDTNQTRDLDSKKQTSDCKLIDQRAEKRIICQPVDDDTTTPTPSARAPEPAGFNQPGSSSDLEPSSCSGSSSPIPISVADINVTEEVTPDDTSATTAHPIRNDTATIYRSNSSNAASSIQGMCGMMVSVQ